MDWTAYPLLFIAGCVAGVVNVIAGGGSFLTLPVLMFLGLPAGVANGTNRVGILIQNIGAVWSFERSGVLDRRALTWAAVPATLGAALGTWAALLVSDLAFKRILAFLMVALSLWTLWSRGVRERRLQASQEPAGPGFAVAAAFFAVGTYGGFIQAGVGFFVLAATSMAGLDLVRGNAVKVLSILCFTVLSLTIFALNGRVEWRTGLVLATGTVLGGLAGARLTVLKGHRWVRAVVTVTMILFALKLWFSD